MYAFFYFSEFKHFFLCVVVAEQLFIVVICNGEKNIYKMLYVAREQFHGFMAFRLFVVNCVSIIFFALVVAFLVFCCIDDGCFSFYFRWFLEFCNGVSCWLRTWNKQNQVFSLLIEYEGFKDFFSKSSKNFKKIFPKAWKLKKPEVTVTIVNFQN